MMFSICIKIYINKYNKYILLFIILTNNFNFIIKLMINKYMIFESVVFKLDIRNICDIYDIYFLFLYLNDFLCI